MSNLNFDATQVEPTDDFSPIPAGTYIAAITDSEMKSTKAGTGSYLQITLQILDGPHKGRLIWDRLNLNNPNPVAVEIAQKTLSAICHATGVMQVNDSQQLHDKPMAIKVTVRDAEGQWDASNEVKSYKAAGQSKPQPAVQQPAPPAQQPTQQQPASSGGVPW